MLKIPKGGRLILRAIRALPAQYQFALATLYLRNLFNISTLESQEARFFFTVSVTL